MGTQLLNIILLLRTRYSYLKKSLGTVMNTKLPVKKNGY